MELSEISQIHERIIMIVKREVSKFETAEELSDRDIKSIETADKIIRAALDIYTKKPKTSGYEAKSDEDLERLLTDGVG